MSRFLAWCEVRGVALEQLEPRILAAYVEQLGAEMAASSVKQHLAALRKLFDYLVTGQAIRFNPAASVKGPRLVIRKGRTPVMDEEEARQLLTSIDVSGVIGARDRAISAHREGVMFRSVRRRVLTSRPLNRQSVWDLVKRRALAAGLSLNVCCHSFRAFGITHYLAHGGTLERAAAIAGHASIRTTQLYKWLDDEIERIRI